MGDVHCEEITAGTTDYLEDALPPGERQRYERHVAGCAACRAGLRELGTLLRLARQIPPPTVSPALGEALLMAFRSLRAGGA
jgi:anti-sigma factor RsiW